MLLGHCFLVHSLFVMLFAVMNVTHTGCKTGLSGFVTGCVVGLVLLVMTPVFEKLPLNVMGAIVVGHQGVAMGMGWLA